MAARGVTTIGLTEEEYMNYPAKHIDSASRSVVSETENAIYGKIDQLLKNIKSRNDWKQNSPEAKSDRRPAPWTSNWTPNNSSRRGGTGRKQERRKSKTAAMVKLLRNLDLEEPGVPPPPPPAKPPSKERATSFMASEEPLAAYIKSGEVTGKFVKRTAPLPPHQEIALVPSGEKTAVQQVIGGLPSATAASNRGYVAEQKHRSRLRSAKKADGDFNVMEGDMLRQYHFEQQEKTNLMGSMDSFVESMMGHDPRRAKMTISDVQNILDESAKREQDLFKILKKFPSSKNKVELISLKLELERNGTTRLRDILGLGGGRLPMTVPSTKGERERKPTGGSPNSVRNSRKRGMRRTEDNNGGEGMAIEIPSLEHLKKNNEINEMWDRLSDSMEKSNHGGFQGVSGKVDHEFTKSVIYRISKAINKISDLMGREKGHKRLLANAHALPALAIILEKLSDFDPTPRMSGTRSGKLATMSAERSRFADQVTDRCLMMMSWIDCQIKRGRTQARGNENLDEMQNDIAILQQQWEMLDSVLASSTSNPQKGQQHRPTNQKDQTLKVEPERESNEPSGFLMDSEEQSHPHNPRRYSIY